MLLFLADPNDRPAFPSTLRLLLVVRVCTSGIIRCSPCISDNNKKPDVAKMAEKIDMSLGESSLLYPSFSFYIHPLHVSTHTSLTYLYKCMYNTLVYSLYTQNRDMFVYTHCKMARKLSPCLFNYLYNINILCLLYGDCMIKEYPAVTIPFDGSLNDFFNSCFAFLPSSHVVA